MAVLPTPTRECEHCTRGNGLCHGEVVAITTAVVREVFVRCAPAGESESAHRQAQKFYDCLPRLLDQHGMQMGDVILERAFFRDLQRDGAALADARDRAYAQAGVSAECRPVTSCVEQPPCRPHQAFELQVHAVAPAGDEPVRIHSFPAGRQGAMAKLVEAGGYRHLYLTSVHGCGSNGQVQPTFREQADTMFRRTAEMLSTFGTDFSKVLRTWCYLQDIERDYAEFNTSRNDFFRQQAIQRLPASTGIRSGLAPPGALCGIDLYALLNPQGAAIEVMRTPTLNEAAEYGASFSRGMKLVLPDRIVLFISGTASVDERGATVHINDTDRQIERMLLNVRELLAPHGASFSDVVQVITYLKSRQDTDLLLRIWDAWGLAGLPNTLVEAAVCRPDLLCELEAIAILPR